MRKTLLIATAVAVVLATAGAGLAMSDESPERATHTERPAAASAEDYKAQTAAMRRDFEIDAYREHLAVAQIYREATFVQALEEEAAREAEAARAAEQAAATVSRSAPASGGGGGAAACIRQRESGGDYSINTGNGYYGAYQFNQNTWNNAVTSMGRGDLAGTSPSSASPADQDAAFNHLYAGGAGASHWGGAC